MRVICPLSACSSYDKRDQFLGLLSDIAVVTKASEPNTLAYAWFQSSGDNSAVPNHYVRGFEVYENESDLAEVHRLSEPYKKMRLEVGRDQILEQPTDLRFLQPTGVGFMVRSDPVTFQKSESHAAEKNVIVVLEIKPEEDMKAELLKELEDLGEHVKEHEQGTASFWILEYLPEYSDDGIVILARFDNNSAYESHLASRRTEEARMTTKKKSSSVRTTTWVESGIGFIGR